MSLIDLKNIRVDPVNAFYKFHTTIDVLRLDLLHPLISGNKWFKLKPYIKEAKKLDKKIIATFGGAYSNHILATAAAAKEQGFRSIGIIRGERPQKLSFTLEEAMQYEMELFFSSRENYKNKMLPADLLNAYKEEELYLIDEGGYGIKGAEGTAEIAALLDTFHYTHIITAVGTGTTLSGLTRACTKDQLVTGISVLKNNFSLRQEIEALLTEERKKYFDIMHDYHFGGYAKYTDELIQFMNHWFASTGIPSDFVYTGKLFYAVHDLIQKDFFPSGSELLIIHSGGLQGNRSLPKGTLIF